MPRTVRGVVVKAEDAPAVVEEIVIPDPGAGEVLVDVHTCGVCRSDQRYQAGKVGGSYPFLLGHEAVGVVEEAGAGVTEVAPGDKVVLNFRAVCNECWACLRGIPEHCATPRTAEQKMTLTDGTPLTASVGIGAFAEKTLVAAGQCTRVQNVDDSEDAAVGLLGCGVTTGAGAAINTGEVKPGESVAVIGCGGVGSAAVAGAGLAGAGTVIAVDIEARKLDIAREVGATHTVNSAETDPVAAIREITGGVGADVVIDAVATPTTYGQAFHARNTAGRLVLAGIPDPSFTVDMPMIDIFRRGTSLRSSRYGDCLPSRDIPMLVRQYKSGALNLDAFVSERISLDEVQNAFEAMKRGEVLRSVVQL